MADFYKVVGNAMKLEGGYQADPTDDGNYIYAYVAGKGRVKHELVGTKYGISAQAFQQAYGVVPTAETMKNLKPEGAKAIFKKLFWDGFAKGDYLQDTYVAYIIFQIAIGAPANFYLVRSAINKAAKTTILTGSGGLTISDAQKINNQFAPVIFDTIWKNYYAFLQKLPTARHNPGWFTRMNEIRKMALTYYSQKYSNLFKPKSNGRFL